MSRNKDNSEASKEAIKEVLEYTQWDLGIRHGSRLKLLYSVPYDDLNAIGDREEDEAGTGPVEVTYAVEDLHVLLQKVRKGLKIEKKYHKKSKWMEEELQIKELETLNQKLTVSQLGAAYGDPLTKLNNSTP